MPDVYSDLPSGYAAFRRSPEYVTAYAKWVGRVMWSGIEEAGEFSVSSEFRDARYAYRRRINGGSNSNDH